MPLQILVLANVEIAVASEHLPLIPLPKIKSARVNHGYGLCQRPESSVTATTSVAASNYMCRHPPSLSPLFGICSASLDGFVDDLIPMLNSTQNQVLKVAFANNPPGANDNCVRFPNLAPSPKCPYPGFGAEVRFLLHSRLGLHSRFAKTFLKIQLVNPTISCITDNRLSRKEPRTQGGTVSGFEESWRR